MRDVVGNGTHAKKVLGIYLVDEWSRRPRCLAAENQLLHESIALCFTDITASLFAQTLMSRLPGEEM